MNQTEQKQLQDFEVAIEIFNSYKSLSEDQKAIFNQLQQTFQETCSELD